MFKAKTQPHCRYCGKPIRKHVRTVYVHKASPSSTYNSATTEFSRTLVLDTLPATMQDCARLTNWHVVSVRKSYQGGGIGRFGEWDGESWIDEFFCSGSCAQGMGYAACRDHSLVTKAWRKATGND